MLAQEQRKKNPLENVFFFFLGLNLVLAKVDCRLQQVRRHAFHKSPSSAAPGEHRWPRPVFSTQRS